MNISKIIKATEAFAKKELSQACDLLAEMRDTDARALYTLGLCRFANGEEDDGIDDICSASEKCPGITPYVSVSLLVDVLRAILHKMEPMATDGNLSKNYLTVQSCLAEGLAAIGEREEAYTLGKEIIWHSRRTGWTTSLSRSTTESEIRKALSPQPIWHSMDLGRDLFIQGQAKDSVRLARELLEMDFPDMSDKTVLDIGAWGGFFSFEAERRGAYRVRAVDFYSWVTDFQKLHLWSECMKKEGKTPNHYSPPEDEVYDFRNLPGRKPFDLQRELTDSKVEPIVCDFMDINPCTFGKSDVVLFLGVLYHMRDPFGGMRKIYELTNEVAIIETHALYCPEREELPLWEFYSADQINHDSTTWWAPNVQGLVDMAYAAGFSRVEVKSTPASTLLPQVLNEPRRARLIIHACV